MALDQPRRGHGDADGHEPQRVHQGGGVGPGPAVERDVVALQQHDAGGGVDGEVVCDGVFDGVVEAGRVDGAGGGFNGFAERLDEVVVGGGVEGEGGAAAEDGFLTVGQGGELRAGQVVAV